MSPIRLSLALFALWISPAAAFATQWQVDAAALCPGSGTAVAPFCTIQSALDAAVSGDEIVVAPGIYLERLDFLGKDVWLHSTAGAGSTVVDAEGAGSVVTFARGEGPTAVLQGFTLRGGSGTDLGDPAYATAGGGILCRDASPTIVDNVVEACAATRGGGIVLLRGAPRVSGNTIRNNHAEEAGGGVHCGDGTAAHVVSNAIQSNGAISTGGGIDVLDAAPLLEDNLVEDNTASSAAGIEVHSTFAVVIRRNVIRGNHTDEDEGGGLSVTASTLVEDNEIVGNKAFGPGGGVVAHGGTFRRNRIAGNFGSDGVGVAAEGGATFDGDVIEANLGSFSGGVVARGLGGESPVVLSRVTVRANGWLGVTVSSGSLVLEDCIIADNEEGLILWDSGCTATIRRCTFAGNHYSAVVTYRGAHASLTGCIAWGNALTTGLELAPETGTIDATGSIVRLGYPGAGNLDVDPLYVDAAGGDYSLRFDSPAIDAGDPSDAPTGTDAAAHPRWLDGNLDRTRIVDLGAFEFDQAHVAVTADARPGGALTLDLTGASGLYGITVVGLELGEVQWTPFGALLVDLSTSAWILPVAALPIHLSGTIPPMVPDETMFVFQGVAVLLMNGAGNLSNVATVVIRQP